MEKSIARALNWSRAQFLLSAPLPRTFTNFLGRKLLNFILTLQGLGAFALITLGVMFTKFGAANCVIRPLVVKEISRAGTFLLPMTMFMSAALGLVVIGQTVSLMTRMGANNFLGTVMVTVVVRELGPLLAALLVLTRTGLANVIQLSTARALGEVEALEVLGIDPIHYLVVPRVIGMALGMSSLAVYTILVALGSGYLWAFLQDVPLRPGDYVRQLAGAMSVLDFILLAVKTWCFGTIIAVVTCYHGLAQPLRLVEISRSTVSAVAQSVIVCVLLDALFIIIYLVA